MNTTPSLNFRRYVLAFALLCLSQHIFAQSWLELRERGANFNDIKAAFERQYGSKLKKMKRELREEVTQSNVRSGKSEKELEGMIQYMRWAHFVEPRVKESNGDLSVINRGIVQALADRNRAGASSRTGAGWSVIGPQNTPTNGGNGRVNAVRAHPSVSGTLFACTPGGGLWKTTDNGGSWTPIADAIAVLGATDVAFDPSNANTMYLATGDGEAADTYTTGIYKSTDGGSTWAATGLTYSLSSTRTTFSKILVHPTDGSVIVGGAAGIHRSTNGGTSWTQVSTASVRDLEFKPGDPTVVYAGGYGTTAFYKSTNSGVTWASAGTGLPTTGIQRTALAVTALDATYIYALVANNTDYGFKGLYLSTDGGATFTLKSSAATPSTATPNILGWNANGADAGGQGWYDLNIVVDPSVKTTIYTGGVNTWKSINSGTSWTIMSHWSGSGAPYSHADCHDLTFIGTTLYAGNDGGVFTSANGGSTWTDRSSNLAIAQLYGMGISQTSATTIIAGHQDNGTTFTTNASAWSEINGGDGMLCFIDRTNNSQLFSSIYNGDLYRSTNGGSTFSNVYTVPSGGWVTPWLQDPVTAATLYAGGTSVYKSTNSGTTWASIGALAISTLVSIDVSKTNNQHIIAASATNIKKTTVGGTTWTDITAGLPSGVSILSVYYDPLDVNKIYAALASYSGQSVYYSANEGTSWTNISSGLPSVPANCFVIQENNGDLYCGTDIGVYLRSVGTSTWVPFTTGMPGIRVTDLEVYAAGGKLRAATFARGIWESALNSNNNAPTVSITLPANNATFSLGSNVVINATASDPDGTVSKVEFYQGTTLLGTSTTAPYTYTWITPPIGSYALTAKAYDNLSAIGTSTVVNITVAIANDAGISAIATPNGTTTLSTVTPSVTLKNFGTTTLTATTISYKVDANALSTFNWTGSLAAGATATVTFPSITGYVLGAHTFTAQTGDVNGGIDGNTANDGLTVNFTYSLPAACTNAVTSPYTQNFNASTTIPTGWTNTTSWLIAANHGNGTGNGIYKNIWSSTPTAQFTMIGIGPLAANDQLGFDYRILDYATSANYPTNTMATPAGWGNIQVQISTDCGVTFSTIYTINDATHVVNKSWAAKSIPLSTYAGQTVIFKIIANWAVGDWYIDFDNINISTITSAPACTTLTSPANSATGVCPNGVVLQWASAANATSYDIYTNLPGVTSPINVVGNAYSVVGVLPLNTNYTWQVVPKNSIGAATGCSTWNFTTGSSLCYCTPTYTNGCANGLDVITRLQLGTLDNSSATACGTGNYNFYSTATVPNLPQSVQQSMTVFFGNDPDQFVGAWIDYNQNGTFETTEYLGGNSVTAGANGSYIINFTVPTTALTGQTRLRVRGGEDFALTSAQACGASSDTYGQTEDYMVNILTSAACSGVPSANVTMGNTTACVGEVLSLSLQNTYALTGITYQWQYSVAGGSWTDITGATNPTAFYTYTQPVNFWCAIKCSGGAPIYSTPLSITSKAVAQCYCTPTASCGASFINSVSVASTTLSNLATGCSNAALTPSSYIIYPASGVTTATLTKGTAYNLNVTTSTAQIVSVWVDYNQNGTFEATEWAQVSTATTANTATIMAMTVPNGAATGFTIMRIRSRGTGNPNAATDACTTFASGETEDYWVNIQPAVIPVELKTITAYVEGEANKIDWVTASEKALKAFVVERSIDNQQWVAIGTAAPKGGSKETFYSLTDEKPLLLGYYRLRTLELSGDDNVSKIVSVKRYNAKKLVVLNVSPVPTTEGVTFDFIVTKETPITVTLTNVVGQVVKTETLKAAEGANKTVFNLANLPNGTYFMTVSDGEMSELKRIVKQ